tara:strand:+ start:132 stop:1139 length:1008 start_codon:yes stop_codon:yes gene_type:complete
MRKISIVILLLIFCFGVFKCTSPIKEKISKVVQINDFTIEINIDTLSFKSDLDIEKVFFFKERYYAVFSNKGMSFSKKMFVLDENGDLEKEVDLFEEIQRWRHFYKIQENNNKVYFVRGYSEEGFKMNLKKFTFEEVTLEAFPIFKDDDYEIFESCYGEWGGLAFFKNKKDGIKYETSSTCPIIVNKINEEYFITNYMRHSYGFTSVIKISNPRKLKVTDTNKDSLSININNSLKEHSYKGAKVLLDTIDFKIDESFVVKDKLKHIYMNNTGTYIGETNRGKMKELYKFDFKFKADFNHSTSDGKHILTFISEDENKGLLVIKNNSFNFHFIKKN